MVSWCSVGVAENHHHFFICDEVGGMNSRIELEINFEKNYKNMLDEFEYLIQRWKEK